MRTNLEVTGSHEVHPFIHGYPSNLKILPGYVVVLADNLCLNTHYDVLVMQGSATQEHHIFKQKLHTDYTAMSTGTSGLINKLFPSGCRPTGENGVN